MPQVLKDEVRDRIVAAALEVFARRGYDGATVGEIAAAAGISAGNVYRYFESKEALFAAAVPDAFARRFRGLLRRRVRALDGVRDLGELDRGDAFFLASEELLSFAIAHRLAVVVLLDRAAGSRHQGFAGRTVEDLVRLAVAHFRGLDPALVPTPAMRFVLVEVYRGLVRMTVSILERFQREEAIREAVGAFTRYHLNGLESFFRGTGDPASRPLEPDHRARRGRRPLDRRSRERGDRPDRGTEPGAGGPRADTKGDLR